jgi:hypothetical protein
MAQIPVDAAHWDSGDWIEWHRGGPKLPDLPCAAKEDPDARLALLQVSLARAARSFFELTGRHLGIYDQMARVHAARHFGIPLTCEDVLEETGVSLLTLRPFSRTQSVSVDLTFPFSSVLVVRIDNDFQTEARMITRRWLGEGNRSVKALKWRELPRGR